MVHPPSVFKSLLMKWIPAALALCLAAAPLAAQETNTENPNESRKIRDIMLLLSDQMLRVQNELESLKSLPPSHSLGQQKEKLILRLDELNRNFESLATKLQTEDLYLEQEKDSDWIDQLKSLTIPVLAALSEVTEKPRRIEHLKKRVSTLETQLKNFEVGRRNIQELVDLGDENLDTQNAMTRKYLTTLKHLQNKYDTELVQIQLSEAKRSLSREMQHNKPIWESATQSVKNFFKNRGLNLLITAGVFFLLWYLMTRLRVFIIGEKSLIQAQPWMRKLMSTAYSGLVLTLCVVTSLIALYFLHDWLLLSVIIMFLIALAWASRQFLPRLFQEVRLALNLGTAREHERLIWNGVPWKIHSLGLQATLLNPRLEGGRLQLPLGELIGKHSRPIVEGEPWFPTKIGNWVRLSDNTYGRVEHQTMEQVILRLKGDTLKYYATTEFLGMTPMNLSKGFRYEIDFGLDYSLQPRICDEIPRLFERGLWDYLEHHHQKISPDFTYTGISFDHAGSSSLNLKVIVNVEGRCAERYDEIQREIQSTLVRICNENRLTIPFNQLTITLPKGMQSPSEA